MFRTKVPSPEHYYEEYLYKKDLNDKVYKKLWVGLQGNCLCFYSNHKDLRRVDCLSLDEYVSLKEPPSNFGVHSSSEFLFSLRLKQREVQLKAESLESREMWRAYIITMTELSIPTSLTLLPGPLLALREALEKEKNRRAREEKGNKAQKETEDGDKPSCYCRVSRMEAENLLKQNPDCGSLLLRPGGSPNAVSVTTCQQNHGNFVIKHYKVVQQADGCVIQVEPQVFCHSLEHVVSHFVKSSHNALVPFEKLNEYENQIGVLEVNKEDGEVTMRYLPECPAKISPKYKAPPPLPRTPIPQDDYENPDLCGSSWGTTQEVQRTRRSSEDIPFQDKKNKRLEKTRSGVPFQNNLAVSLEEELKTKLRLRRAQIE
ncbi:signal-transducing adaptor protein 2 [Bombina bombina]|uniref:signal-transducing adaptor protein 2 n=1 Tax=Bombina bombina TaxID=8345 RepID=UPI00235B1751|nr:signal-transducing adaptor protein 2 [Bombina bombina]